MDGENIKQDTWYTVKNGEFNEIFIGVMKDDGVWYQDLAIVRNAYSYNSTAEVQWDEENFEVLVFGNENDEDYTECFCVGLYHGGI